MDECEKSQTGEHEVDLERMIYAYHVGGRNCALFKVECLHCGQMGEIEIEGSDAEWL